MPLLGHKVADAASLSADPLRNCTALGWEGSLVFDKQSRTSKVDYTSAWKEAVKHALSVCSVTDV